MTEMLPEILTSLGTIAGAVGGSWFGLKRSLNGTREQVKETHGDVKEIFRLVHDSNTRIGVLEVRQEFNAQEIQEIKHKCGANHG